MAHVVPNARPRMAGPAVPAHVVPRQGWRHEPKTQRIAGLKEAMRLRTTGSRMAERPAMDGRAGLSGRGDVAPWTAADMLAASSRCAMAHVAPNARPRMAGPAFPAHVVPRQGWRREPKAQRIAGLKDAMRSRTTGSRMAERPAMDGRAGLSRRGDVAPWTATAMPAAFTRCAMAPPAPMVPRHEWQREPRAPRAVQAMAATMTTASVRHIMLELRHASIAATPIPFPRMKRSCTHRTRWRPLSPRSVT
ncbi:hypothetical protein [Xanthomonas sp. SS]|uniref:hypothetical protein n=1 Tax=Xanthomonas sp. SS TaxID=2724122 RepID=UPI00163A9BCA|nr:hypothetical protein [Xanthomonas sp. SS]